MNTLKLDKIDKTVEIRYGISLPSEYNARPKKSWPVLCVLHGNRECGRSLDNEVITEDLLTKHGPLRKRNDCQKPINDFIVVVPQMPCSKREGKRSFCDNWIDYADTVRQIVETVQREHRVDQECTYLTGFSFGGNGVFDIGLAQSDFWAALWPVDPTKIPEAKNKPKRPVWLFSRSSNRLNFQEVKIKEPNIPNGDFLYTYSNKDHPGTATLAYNHDKTYDWLRKKRL